MKNSFLKPSKYKIFSLKKVGVWTGVATLALTILGKENIGFSEPLETSKDTSLVKEISVDYNGGVLPWVLGIDPDKLRLYKDSLDRVKENISSYCLDSKVDLTSLNLATNVKNKLSKMILGTSKPGSSCQSMFFEPVWLEYRGDNYFFLNVIDSKSNLVFQSNLILSVEYNPKNDSNKNNLIEQGMKSLFDSFVSKRLSSPSNRVKLSLRYSNKDMYLPFSLIMEEALLSQGGINIIHGLSREWLDLASQYLKPGEEKIRNRANRTCSLSWYKDEINETDGTIDIILNWRMSESVFTNHIGSSIDEKLSFKKESSKLVLLPKDGLTSLKQSLGEQQKELAAGSPQVLKIDRAWVYLDKGRAAGLRLYDRFIIGNESYGHVVGYYGVEEKLVSEKGYPVSEGAILYVRKGQNKVRLGQEVRYDPTTYPKYP